MVQIKKSKDSLLFLIALAPCLCLAQINNEGIVYVHSGTVLSLGSSAFINKPGAHLINDGELYVYNDFTNAGTVDFTPGQTSGITKFQSRKSTSLAVSGTGTSKFYNVDFNDTDSPTAAGFGVTNTLNVFGDANFIKGVVTTGPSDLISFENDATASNASDASHVNGYVVKKGNKAFVYPIGGNGKYRPASISAPSEAETAFKAKYFFENPNSLYPVSSLDAGSSLTLIDNAEYWEVRRTGGGTSNVFVTLKWDEATTPSEIFAEPFGYIHLVRWDDVKKVWIDEGGVANPGKKEVITVAESLGDYGIFTLARSSTTDNIEGISLPHFAISPNNDNINDELVIQGLDVHPNNKVTVFDRLGRIMFETTRYNTDGNVFKGYLSNGKVMPLGTYFYTVEYLDESTGHRIIKTNYLYINLK